MATLDEGPIFPVEIFQKILEECRSDTGITHLWTDCRDVCTSWRDIVESIYSKNFLSKIAVTIRLGYRDSRRVEFAFKKLADEDNRLAVFRLFDEDDQYDEMLSTRLKASLAIRSPGYWPNPPQLVYFKQIVNDTELPSFRIKYSPEIEISCDWRGLLTALLKEEKLVNRESVSTNPRDFDLPPWVFDARLFRRVPEEKSKVYLERVRFALDFMEAQLEEKFSFERRRRILRQFSESGIDWTANAKQQKRASRSLKDARIDAMQAYAEKSDEEDPFRLDMADEELEDVDMDDLISDGDNWEDTSGTDLSADEDSASDSSSTSESSDRLRVD